VILQSSHPRDKGFNKCEKCKKPVIEEKVIKLDKIKIEVWEDHQCWKCKKYG
jgi:hypothetical protein